jgi:3-hydroxypropionyl-CoA synthetase (ADP-forming)
MQLAGETKIKINEILRKANADSRCMLYEHEIYGILKELKLEVPRHVFVTNPAQIDETLLKPFTRAMVVKVVSPQIAHKQKLGGVKIIKNFEPLYVQFVLSRIREEVLSHFSDSLKPEIKGFLLMEFIPYTNSLGNEVILGFKEDNAFGPIVTLSKGGDDAEFFATYFDPANLFIPPLSMDKALQMANTLNIRHKYAQIGHPEFLNLLAKALSVLSRLAYDYSFIAEEKPEFIIKSMDINPFVISEDQKFVAIDGFAEFVPIAEDGKNLLPVNKENLWAFFKPTGIAVIGISADSAKYSLGWEIAHLLHDMSRKDMYLINPKGGEVQIGETIYPLYRTLQEIPATVELIVYCAQAQTTVEFISNIPRDIMPAAMIIISSIPSHIKYADFARQLDAVKPGGMRVIGPNCMGVFYAPRGKRKGLNTIFIDEKKLEVKSSDFSNTVLLTQSGALAVTEIDKLQNSRSFKAVVSFGNKYDVKITDLLAHFAEESSIEVIALYIEGMEEGEGRQFYELARRIKKPVIVYKSGRTEAGARAAASHTASLSGSYDVFRAACLQAGVIMAENIEDHYDYVKAFSSLSHRIPQKNRVAGVVNAGFESAVGADELKNLRQAQLSPGTVIRLNEINKQGLVDTSSPFLDITPMADDKTYTAFVEAVLQDENVDCVFVAIVPHAVYIKTTTETCHDPEGIANLLVQLNQKYNKPMVISVNGGRYYQDFVAILEEGGLPVYTDIRAAIKSLDKFVTFHTKKNKEIQPQ